MSDSQVTGSYEKQARETVQAFGFEQGYESEQLLWFGKALIGASRFLDVGANKGLYAYMANLVMKDGYIALVEADPKLAESLRNEIARWPNANGNRLEVFAVAAGDCSSKLPFYIGSIDTIGTLTQKNAKANPDYIDVPCEPLDKLFRTQKKTLIKIDVEGFEYRVISGSKKLLDEQETVIFIELHGWGDAERGKYPFHVVALLNRLGFASYRIGRSYAYEFRRERAGARIVQLLRNMPILAFKYSLRRFGLRNFIADLFGLSK